MSVYSNSRDFAKHGVALKKQYGENSPEFRDFVEDSLEHFRSEGTQVDTATMFETEFGVGAGKAAADLDHGQYMEAAFPVVMSSVTARLATTSMAATLMRPATPEEYLLTSLVGEVPLGADSAGSKMPGLFEKFKVQEFKENEEPLAQSMSDDFKRMPDTKKQGSYIMFSRESMWKRGDYINQYPIAERMRESLLDFRETERLIPAFLNKRGVYDRSDVRWNAFYSAAPVASLGTNVTDGGPYVNVQVNPYVNYDNFDASNLLAEEMTGFMRGDRESKMWNTIIASRAKARIMNAQLNSATYEADNAGTLAGFSNVRFQGQTSTLIGDRPTRILTNRRFTDAIATAWGKTAAQAQECWYHGNPSEQFAWGSRTGWAMQVEQIQSGTRMQLRQSAFGLMCYDAGEVVVLDPREGGWNIDS